MFIHALTTLQYLQLDNVVLTDAAETLLLQPEPVEITGTRLPLVAGGETFSVQSPDVSTLFSLPEDGACWMALNQTERFGIA